MADPGEVTTLLHLYREGDRSAFDRLVPLVYDDLRRIARRQLSKHRKDDTLDTTSLVHEAYMKLARETGASYEDRGHLLAVSAIAMRQVIVSHARTHAASKRGGADRPLTLDENEIAVERQAEQILALDAALERLSRLDPNLGRVVECRFFAGLGEEETSQAMGVSLRTAQRAWMKARAWLREELGGPGRAPEGAP